MPMFTRRSGRAITSDFTHSRFVLEGSSATIPPLPAAPSFSIPKVDPPVPVPTPENNEEMSIAKEEPKWKKNGRAPKGIRKKKLNAKLARIMTPKPALSVLTEMLPTVQINATQSPATAHYMVEIINDGDIIGTAIGKDKDAARNVAAITALKNLFTTFMQKSSEAKENPSESLAEPMETEDGSEKKVKEASVPWFNLASFAMFRLLNDWKSEGIQVPLREDLEAFKRQPKIRTPQVGQIFGPPKEELPSNSASMHPTLLLNYMMPGVTDIPISSTPSPELSITVGYQINGRMFSGTATNRKAARKLAAMAALKEIYGCDFPLEAPPPPQ